MDWRGSIGYGLVRQDLKRYIYWFQLDVLAGFQNLFSFLEKEISTFLVFISLVDHTVHIRTNTCIKITFQQHILPQIAFLDISSQNHARTSQVFQSITKL